MNQREFVTKRRRSVRPVLRLLANRLSHQVSRSYSKQYPQLAIFAFEHIGLRIQVDGRYEGELLEAIFEFLTDRIDFGSSSALDVGANVGNHALFFAEYFKVVHAFEPNPRVARLLDLNAQLANNVCVHELACGDEEGQAGFSVPFARNLGGGRIVQSAGGLVGEGLLEVPIRRLDDLFGGTSSPVRLIKIDVEGLELAVLRGASSLIARDRPIVLFEQARSEFRGGVSEVTEFLASLNYRFVVPVANYGFGVSAPARVLQRALQGLLGCRYAFESCSSFGRKDYPLIIALPKD